MMTKDESTSPGSMPLSTLVNSQKPPLAEYMGAINGGAHQLAMLLVRSCQGPHIARTRLRSGLLISSGSGPPALCESDLRAPAE